MLKLPLQGCSRLSGTSERLLQGCGRVSGTSERLLQGCGKVSGTSERPLQGCNKVSGTSERPPQACSGILYPGGGLKTRKKGCTWQLFNENEGFMLYISINFTDKLAGRRVLAWWPN